MRITVLLCIALATVLQARVRVEWTAESSKAKAAEFQCYRGETLELAPAFTEYGVSVSNYSVSVYWQTNGMGTAWWSTNELVFAPSMDVGAASYTLFVRAAMSNGVSYRANAIIRMLNSPGATPNSIPLPVQRIDFATTSYANAPWFEYASWLAWLSTNTYIKVESDPGIPAAISSAVALAGTNTQSALSFKVSLTDATYTDTIARAASALQVETDAIALNAIATNRITKLWDTTGTQFIDATGAVWRISTIVQTNYGVSVLSTLNSYGTFPPQTWYDIPSFDYGWETEIFQDNAYFWYDKGGMSQCAWVAHLDFADGEAGILEMRLSLELSQQNLPSPPEGVAYVVKTFTSYQVTNRVDSLVFSSELETQKELHRDSATNVIWRSVYSNGWSWLIAYTNYPAQ
jgi:hypothetical protein